MGHIGLPEGMTKNRPLESPELRCVPRFEAVSHGRTAPCRQQKTREQINVRTADGGWQVGKRRRPVGKGPCTADPFDLTSLLEHHCAVLRRHVKFNDHIKGQKKRCTKAHWPVQLVPLASILLKEQLHVIRTIEREPSFTLKALDLFTAATGDGKCQSPQKSSSISRQLYLRTLAPSARSTLLGFHAISSSKCRMSWELGAYTLSVVDGWNCGMQAACHSLVALMHP